VCVWAKVYGIFFYDFTPFGTHTDTGTGTDVGDQVIPNAGCQMPNRITQ